MGCLRYSWTNKVGRLINSTASYGDEKAVDVDLAVYNTWSFVCTGLSAVWILIYLKTRQCNISAFHLSRRNWFDVMPRWWNNFRLWLSCLRPRKPKIHAFRGRSAKVRYKTVAVLVTCPISSLPSRKSPPKIVQGAADFNSSKPKNCPKASYLAARGFIFLMFFC